MGEIQKDINEKIAKHNVMIFSKTTCGYCRNAKSAFEKDGIAYEVMELNKESNGSEYQDVLQKMTGARSVPRVFIKGKFFGGGDAVVDLHRKGRLAEKCN